MSENVKPIPTYADPATCLEAGAVTGAHQGAVHRKRPELTEAVGETVDHTLAPP